MPIGIALRSLIAKKSDGDVTFAPDDVTGLTLWVDFSDSDTLFVDSVGTKVSSDGDAIKIANDKSGNDFHVSQESVVGYRPLYKTGIKNSLSVARFDGSDDYFDIPNLGISGSDNRTVMFVAKIVNNSEYPFAFGRGYPFDYHTFRVRYDSGNLRFEIFGAGYTSSLGSLDTWYLYTAILNGTKLEDVTLHINGDSEICTGTETLNTENAYNYMGVKSKESVTLENYAEMDMGEFVVYDNAISSGDLADLKTYFNNKWNLY